MNKLITSLLLFFSLSLHAQKNEIKINALSFLFNEVNISYERMVTNKIGIEVGLGYIFDPERLDTVDSSLPLPAGTYGTLPFKKTAWSLLANARYYINLKPRGNKIMLGIFSEYRTKPKLEAAYFETYEFYFNEPDNFLPKERFLLGGLVGFKFSLFKKKIIVEPLIALGLDMVQSDLEIGGFGFDMYGFLKLNVGYRF